MITVCGASDDLIEVEGDITEEFNYLYDTDAGDLVAFSDGTILRVFYTQAGIWRITPVARGSAALSIEQATEEDEDNYSDKARLDGAITWVVHGDHHATSK